MSLTIVKESIINLETDAIVNAANSALLHGSGVCGAIFKAAGPRELQQACDAIGGCETGSAVITPGFNLKAKYVIHAVGPRWMGGTHDEPKLLYSAYQASLALAAENGCRSIAFPLISAGIYGYPMDQAWRQAIRACLDYQKAHPEPEIDILFAVIDERIYEMGQRILAEMR